MKISIVVPAFNEEKLLARSLAEIRRAGVAIAERGWELELIVCDNNSTDRTAALAREAGARVVFEPVNQIARARNTGAAAAGGDWIVFIDADSHPSEGLFREMADAIDSGRCLAGGATVRMEDAERWARGLVRIWNLISRCRRWMAGSFIFCQAAAFRALGGFSPDLFVSEEIEFSKRLNRMARRRGERVRILHRYPLSTSARKLRLYTRADYGRFILRVFLTAGGAVKNRDACAPWYDGRR